MEAVTELEVIVGNLATNYLEKILAEPAMLDSIAENLAQEAKNISKKFPDQQQQIEFVSQELMNVMSRSLAVLDSFGEAIQRLNKQDLDEKQLLIKVEEEDFSTREFSQEILPLLAEMTIKSLNYGLSIEEIYFENYFIEYISNLMEIHIVVQLLKKPKLMMNLHQEMTENGNVDLPYQVFKQVSETFKESLQANMAYYQQLL